MRSHLRYQAVPDCDGTSHLCGVQTNELPRKSRARSIAFLATLFTVAGLLTPTASKAEPNRFVGIKKKIAPADGQSVFPTWTIGTAGSFAITVTNTTSSSFPLFAGEYVVEEHVPAGLTVTSTGGGDSSGSWSCSPAAPQTGPVTLTCTFLLQDGPDGPQIYPGTSLPSLIVGVRVDAPPDPGTGGYTNCAEVVKAGSVGGSAGVTGDNPACITVWPLVAQTLPAICVEKYLDWNANGVRDAGERLVSGIEFPVRNSAGEVVEILVSSDTEPVCFYTSPGRYVVTERVPRGWERTYPASGRRRVRLRPGETKTVMFGNRPLSELCVHKFEDRDSDGVHDEGEPLLSGWKFHVTAHGTAFTLISGGEDSCATLAPGTYAVAEVKRPGWVATSPPSGVQTVEVHPITSHIVTFGNAKRSCCLNFTYRGGRNDGFSLSGAAEPADPLPGSTTALFFDQTAINKPFEHRIALGGGNCILSATLTIKMRPLGGASDNDTLILRVPGGSQNLMQISTLAGVQWVASDPAQTIALDLAALPGTGPSNIVPSLNALRRLDVMVHDDTSVDFLTLVVEFCECGTGRPEPPNNGGSEVPATQGPVGEVPHEETPPPT